MSKTLDYPRIIPCAVHAPGRNISQVVILTNDLLSALSDVAAKLAVHHVGVLSGLIAAEPGMKMNVISLFIDLTNSDTPLKKLLEELRSLRPVINVEEAVRKVRQMAINGATHMTTFLGKRVVIMDVEGVGAMLTWLVELFGTGGQAILFDMGLRAGRSMARTLRDAYGLEGRDLVETFLALHVAAGWFRYVVIDYDEGTPRFVVRLYENFECSAFKGRGKPSGHMTRGVLAGVFGETYGCDFAVQELKCLAQEDPYCEFVITKPKIALR